jgi:AraC-like DNA-binding protein
MKLKINSCGISDCPPSWHWVTPTSGFSDYDLWTVFRGRGLLTTEAQEKQEFHIHEGASLLLAPNIQYMAKHEVTYPLLVINVHFDFLDDDGKPIYPRELSAKSIADLDFMKSLLTRTVTLFNSNREDEACLYLSAAIAEHENAEDLSSPEADSIWTHIIHEISSEIDAAKKIPSLAEFASRYGYSERYVGKMFAKLRGISFSDYTRNSRISRAKTLLRHTDAPISVIAEETGFYDACHFTKAFRAAVGTSPLAYRKKS